VSRPKVKLTFRSTHYRSFRRRSLRKSLTLVQPTKLAVKSINPTHKKNKMQ